MRHLGAIGTVADKAKDNCTQGVIQLDVNDPRTDGLPRDKAVGRKGIDLPGIQGTVSPWQWDMEVMLRRCRDRDGRKNRWLSDAVDR